MSAILKRLQTRRERVDAGTAETLRDFVRGDNRVPSWMADHFVAIIDSATAERNGWTFVMLGPKQNRMVTHWLLDNSYSPNNAIRLWSCCFEYLDHNTGEILASRKMLASDAGITPNQVSRIFNELVGMGALIRDRGYDKGGDRRAPYRYRMNSLVGTHLPKDERDAQQARDPQLHIVPPAA